MMFQKDELSPANLWVCEAYVEGLRDTNIKQRRSPAALVNQVNAETGKVTYGRHTGLKTMEQLSEADLVCFTISSIDELRSILSTIKTV